MNHTLTYDQYQQGLEQGTFLGLKCRRCNAVTFPPMAVCRECGASECDVSKLKGEGKLRTFTVIRVAPEGVKPPYVVAMAELDEGPWVLGNLVDVVADEADMSLIGKRVKLGTKVTPGDVYSKKNAQVITFSLM
jgi:uncharacterized OB-fold protein